MCYYVDLLLFVCLAADQCKRSCIYTNRIPLRISPCLYTCKCIDDLKNNHQSREYPFLSKKISQKKNIQPKTIDWNEQNKKFSILTLIIDERFEFLVIYVRNQKANTRDCLISLEKNDNYLFIYLSITFGRKKRGNNEKQPKSNWLKRRRRRI